MVSSETDAIVALGDHVGPATPWIEQARVRVASTHSEDNLVTRQLTRSWHLFAQSPIYDWSTVCELAPARPETSPSEVRNGSEAKPCDQNFRTFDVTNPPPTSSWRVRDQKHRFHQEPQVDGQIPKLATSAVEAPVCAPSGRPPPPRRSRQKQQREPTNRVQAYALLHSTVLAERCADFGHSIARTPRPTQQARASERPLELKFRQVRSEPIGTRLA
mmetsp:Transcript_18908/g.44310  ORF Transcript_18908/g.44310 Transcript_18908/m.44310 type:complete len:217 (+) Transcript_18908:217-867(+)